MPTLDQKTALSWIVDPDAPIVQNYSECFDVFNINTDTNQIDSVENGSFIGKFQPNRKRIGGRWCKVDFSTYLRGYTATNHVPEGRLLQACGFKFAGSSPTGYTYTLGDLHFSGEGSGDVLPIDFTKEIDNKYWKALDCVGDATLKFASGQVPTIDFKMKGNYNGPIATVTYPATYIPGAEAASNCDSSLVVTNGSSYSTLVVRSVELALGNVIPARPDMNATYGYAPFAITKYIPTYTMVVELPYTLTDFNPEQVYLNQEQLSVSFTHNTSGSGGDVIDVDFDAYIDEMPVPSDENDMLIYTIKMRQSADTGATNLTLVFE
jgi:hypothetical protein